MAALTDSWELAHRNIEIWGTVISISIPKRDFRENEFNEACKEATTYYQDIDRIFSTFKADSEISKIRNETLVVADACPEVKIVWNKCLELRDITKRAFDPWAVEGGFDPSGYVKGWAAQESLKFFASRGFNRIQINAGGDIVLRGGYEENRPWVVGIRHPDNAEQIAKSYEIFDGAIASSGTYERGAHIIDPRVKVPAVGARAATVIGPDAGIADALATALIVDGRDAITWLADPTLRNYQFWAVDKYGDSAWSYQNPE